MSLRQSFARLAAGLAGIALAATPAAAATKPCLQPANVRDMLVVLTPGIIEQMDKICTRAGKPSFLADPQIKRFTDQARSAGDGLLPSAVAAFKGMSNTPPPAGVSDQLIGMMMREGFAATLITDRFRTSSCEPTRDMVRNLSNLTPSQAGEIVTSLFILSGAKDPSICRP